MQRRAGGRITDGRVPVLVHGDAGHPAPQTIPAVVPALLLDRRSREIAATHIELIPANRGRTVWIIQDDSLRSPQ